LTFIVEHSHVLQVDKMPSDAYIYARHHIPCRCSLCRCPAVKGQEGAYSFTYINEANRYIYFDVPKAASTTLRATFFDNNNAYSMVNPVKELGHYYKFSFVRNPWGRMLSNWKMFTTQPFRMRQLAAMTEPNQELFASLREFPNFVRFACDIPNHHWAPQTLYVPETVDFVGRLENFTEDFSVVSTRLGVTHSKEPPHLNRTKPASYLDYYTAELRDLVGRYYADDIERFDFSFA